MKKIFTLSVFLITYAGIVTAQDYATGKRIINFVDAERSNRQIPTEVYYPADVAGTDVPLAAGTAKFPVVTFGHGFVIPASAYDWLADSLVKNGYIVAFPTTESDLAPSNSAFADDLLFLCNRLTSLNDSALSFLYQRVVMKAAVAGHSMGGGSSFLAAAGSSPVISAIFNFAAAETNPSAIAAATLVNKPALIFSGSGDCIVPASVQQQMFTNVIASCKTYINITGVLHCQFANNNGTCSLGQIFSGCNSSAISSQVVFNKIISLIVPFLDYYLKDICTRGDAYANAYNALTGAEKIINCSPLPGCSTLPLAPENFNGYVINNGVNLDWTFSNFSVKYFIIEKSGDGVAFNFLQQVLPKSSTLGTADYTAIDNLPFPGYSYYRVKIINKDGDVSSSDIIKISTYKKRLTIAALFPNPIKNYVQVELFSLKIQKVTLNVYNATGKLMMINLIPLNAGLNKKSILLNGLPAGIYNLRFKDDEGIITSAKIIKG